MTFVADENFPRPALQALRNAGWEVLSVAEERPGISDEEVAALCSEGQRILLTFLTKISASSFSAAASQPEAGSSCSALLPNLPKKPQTWPWHW